MFISDDSLGLKQAQGLIITGPIAGTSTTRRALRRFLDHEAQPTMNQAATYSATLHYLKAAQATGTKDASRCWPRCVTLPVRMPSPTTAYCAGRQHGAQHVLFGSRRRKVEGPPRDYYKLRAEVPGDQAFRPLKDGGCPAVK
jgi:branched-chain amino acid transport system substrate-binding protein